MSKSDPSSDDKITESGANEAADDATDETTEGRPREIGGRKGPDPTRYGDWEKGGRCIDF
jgi:hypothetical protein